MPVVEQKAGSCYVWIISSFLFLCITAGGILLAIYMSQPDASNWYPIAGISLVCLPWIFWFLTFIYRILSRRFGFRMACWGASVDSNAAAARENPSPTTNLESGTVATDGGRRVHFGEAVVVGDDESVRSNESEAPLRSSSSMAS